MLRAGTAAGRPATRQPQLAHAAVVSRRGPPGKRAAVPTCGGGERLLLDSVRDDLERLPRAEQRWSDPLRSPLERERDHQATFHEWQATVERFDLLAGVFLAGN